MNGNKSKYGSLLLQDSILRKLIYYYGIIQSVHLVALIYAAILWQTKANIALLAPPPTAGWSSQTIYFFLAMGAIDAFNAILSIIFVKLFIDQNHNCFDLGLITLSISMYSGIIYIYPILGSGALAQNRMYYFIIAILFFPIIILYMRLLVKLFKNSS